MSKIIIEIKDGQNSEITRDVITHKVLTKDELNDLASSLVGNIIGSNVLKLSQCVGDYDSYDTAVACNAIQHLHQMTPEGKANRGKKYKDFENNISSQKK